jgi:hypothetical protein
MGRKLLWFFALVAISLASRAQTVARCQERPKLKRRTVSPRAWLRRGLAFGGDKLIFAHDTNGDILESMDLNGDDVRKFAPTIDVYGGTSENFFEHPVASSVGLGGFPCRDFYVGAGKDILHVTNDGSTVDTFVTGLGGDVRVMLFDLSGGFGNDLLVGTRNGSVYRISSLGAIFLMSSVGELIGGMDVAPTKLDYGKLAGQLFVVSGISGHLWAISPSGETTVVNVSRHIYGAEGLYFMPTDFDGRPEEGFYSVLWPFGLSKIEISDFATLRGDAFITKLDEGETFERLRWNGASFDISTVGELNDKVMAELFVTPKMLDPGNGCHNGEKKTKEYSASPGIARFLRPEYYRLMTQAKFASPTAVQIRH